MNELKKQIEGLVTKAAEAAKSDDALKFSQAALNAANAVRVMRDTPTAEA